MPLVCYATANEEQRNLLSFWRRLGVLQHGIGDRWIKLRDEDDIITLCDHDHPKVGWHYLLHENQYAAYRELENAAGIRGAELDTASTAGVALPLGDVQ